MLLVKLLSNTASFSPLLEPVFKDLRCTLGVNATISAI